MTARSHTLLTHLRRQWSGPLMLVAWVAVTIALGEWVYALALAAFFLGLLAIRRRHFVYAAAAALLAMLIYTPVFPTLAALGKSNLNAASHLDTTLNTLLTWESGRQVLPLEVQQMYLILRARHLDDYWVSPSILRDFEQRLVEGLWPARLDPASHHVFRLNTDPASPNCIVVAERRNVILERCR